MCSHFHHQVEGRRDKVEGRPSEACQAFDQEAHSVSPAVAVSCRVAAEEGIPS